MIQAKGTLTTPSGRERDLLLLGLEPENVRRLEAGQPIVLTPEKDPALRALGLDLQIVICVGTVEDLQRRLDPDGVSTMQYRAEH